MQSETIINKLEFFISLFEDLNDALCILTKGADPLYFNLAFKKQFGFSTLEEFKEKGGINQILQDDVVFQQISSSLSLGERWEGNIKMVPNSNPGFLGRLKLNPLINSDSELIGGVLILKELLFETSETDYDRFLEAFVQNANDAVMVTEAMPFDEPGPRIVYVNHAFTHITGYEKEEAIGRSPRFLQGPGTDRKELDKIRKAIADGTAIKVEIKNYKKDGTEFWVDFSIVPIKKAGAVTHFVSIQRDTTQKKKDELMLSSILNAIPAEIAMVDREGKIISINKEWQLFAEKNNIKDPLKGLYTNYFSVCEKSQGDDRNEALAVSSGLKDVIFARKERFSMTYPCHSPNEKRWFEVIISPVHRNEISEAVVMHLNVTDNIIAKQKQKESEEYYRSLFENHPDAICSLDLEGRFMSVNEAVSKLIDLPKEKILYIPFIHFLRPESRPLLLEKFQQAVHGEPQNYETIVTLFNGKEVWLNIISVPIKINGSIIGVYNILKDITENKKDRLLLDNSVTELYAILESITDGFVALDKELNVSYWNKEAERMMGLPRAYMVGKNLTEIKPNAFNETLYPKFYKVLADKKALHFVEYYSVLKIWLEISIYPSQSGLSIFFKDVSERKEIEQSMQNYLKELEKTNGELDQFVYRASHDLRAPLVSVLGLISIFRMEDNAGKREEYLNHMVKSINKLDTFIQDIISYSKNSRTELILTEIDFSELIEEALEHVQYMEEAKRINISYNSANIINFFSDKNRLNVIMNNIISNAIRYHDPNKVAPFIRISADVGLNNHVKITIEDNGLGIPEASQPKIFDMFYRASEKTVGSGLGLYIVSENLKKLKGNITLKSTPGKGTTFIVEIPDLKG